MKCTSWILVTCLGVAAALPARSDPVSDFYRGKTVHMIIGYGAGGGYDLYGRLAAEFLGRHIPGRPTVVAHNMPGAGSLKAAQYLFVAAPRDGTFIGTVTQTIALDAAAADNLAIDSGAIRYIGRMTANIDVGVAARRSSVASFDDARLRQVAIGATGGGSPAGLLPLSLNAYAGAKFKVIRGYQGAPEVILAMERGEVEAAAAIGLPYLIATRRNWIEKGDAVLLYQSALRRHPLLADVPTLPELGLTDTGRAILRVVAGTAEIGRSIMTTPGIPEERLAALRKAFQDMLRDPDFLATCQQQNITLEPGAGEDLDLIVRQTRELPGPILAKFTELLRQ
jgi:tripartite-type tricarboxylate transporter receptor subunit TctC